MKRIHQLQSIRVIWLWGTVWVLRVGRRILSRVGHRLLEVDLRHLHPFRHHRVAERMVDDGILRVESRTDGLDQLRRHLFGRFGRFRGDEAIVEHTHAL